MKIHGKEKIIKFLDWLIEDIENVEYFNIKEFINKYKDISSHEKGYLPYSIESIGKTYNLFENTLNSDEWFKLTRKGIDLKESGKGFNEFEKSLNKKPLDWYKIIPIILTILFGTLSAYFLKANYDLKVNESSLTIQNEFLKEGLVSYKDSVAEIKEQLKLLKLKASENNVITKRKNNSQTD